MAADDTSNNEKTTTDADTLSSTANSFRSQVKDQFSSALNKTQTAQSSFRSTISTAIQTTNATLGDLEDKLQPTLTKLESWKQTATTEYDKVLGSAGTAVQLYQRRHEYGPLAIGAASLTCGGYAMIRRRSLVPAAATALVAGGCMYGFIYGLDEIADGNPWKKK